MSTITLNPTFLSTDIVSSSAICRELGDTAYREHLLTPHNELLLRVIAENGGVQFSDKGDGLIARFDTVQDAVTAASEIQQSLKRVPIVYQGHRIKIRIGIHRAEVEVKPDETGNYHTGELNYACRIESISNADQILLSQSTISNLPNRKDLLWLEWPNRRIKSFDDVPVTVWELLWDGESRGMPGSSWAPDWFIGDVSEYIPRQELESKVYSAFGGSRNNRLVTLHGSGGAGKTRLALTCAVKMAGLFEGRVHFITFHQKREEIDDGGILLLQELANSLGCPNALRDTVLNELASRNATLILIDNFETVAGPSVQDVIIRILQRTRDIRILVTGQKKVEVPDIEYVVELQEGMQSTEAVDLFIQRAANIYHDWQPDGNQRAEIAEIVSLVEFIPLRIEIAAAWLRKRDLTTILKELRQSPFGKISSLPGSSRLAATTREHHRSTELCLQYTCAMLTEQEREDFYRLGLFGVSFTIDTMEEACGIEDADSLLDALMETSLVFRFGDINDYRYTMHRLTAGYCEKMFRESDLWSSVAPGFVKFYSDYANRYITEKTSRSIPDVEWEWESLKRALSIAIALDDSNTTIPLCNTLLHYAAFTNRWSDGVSISSAVEHWMLKNPDQFPDKLPDVQTQLGKFLRIAGSFESSLAKTQAAIEQLEKRYGPDSERLVSALQELNSYYHAVSDYNNSALCLQRTVAIIETRTPDQQVLLSRVLTHLGNAYHELGQMKEAEACLLKAESVLSVHPDRGNHGFHTLLCTLGIHYERIGDFTKSEQYYLKAIEVIKQVQGELSADYGTIHSSLSYLYSLMDRSEESFNCSKIGYETHLLVYGEDNPSIVESLSNYALSLSEYGIEIKRPEYSDQAIDLMRKGLQIQRKHFKGNHAHTATLLNNLANEILNRGEVTEAAEMLVEAVEIASSVHGSMHPDTAVLRCNLGKAYAKLKQHEKALESYQSAYDNFTASVKRAHPNAAVMIRGIGVALGNLNRLPEAEASFMIYADIHAHLSGTESRSYSEALTFVANAQIAQAKYQEARDNVDLALRIIQNLKGDQSDTLRVMDQLFQKLPPEFRPQSFQSS